MIPRGGTPLQPSWRLREDGAEETSLGTTTEKSDQQDPGSGKPDLVVSGEYARPDHLEVETPEKDPPPSRSRQRSSLIQQHQAYLAREAAMRTQLEQQGLKEDILEEVLRQMMKDD